MADDDEFSEPRTVKRGEVVRFHSVELCGPAFVLVLMLLFIVLVWTSTDLFIAGSCCLLL
jgi:hypothetical protein